ncbi:MAG: EAL domain-containing protein [Treponema sp.]|nr:EAL domain-containing protein [Treponema sp.]
METTAFKKIFDTLPQAVVVAGPVYDDKKEIVDVRLEYQNNSFAYITGNAFKPHVMLSQMQDKMNGDIEWMQLFKTCVYDNRILERTFYSFITKCHLKMVVTPIDDGCVTVMLSDVSKGTETEMQLRRQNERLAALTEELSISRANLQSKLDSVKVLNEQLRYSVYYDSLTTLHNRASLSTALSSAVEDAKASGSKFGLLLVDLDNLKHINDSQGHTVGDELIIKFSSILHSLETSSISCFRFSSDEFFILMRHLKSAQPLENIGNDLRRRMNDMGVGLSGGLAIYPDDAQTDEELLKYTDLALSDAKRHGRNKICHFERQIKEVFLHRIDMESKLSEALKKRLFQLYYQPQFEVATGKLRGFEALIRWHDSELGWVSPEKFIPLAEESRLVIPIGDWVIDTALMTLAQWEREKGFDGILSINISPLQFKDKGFMKKLQDKVLWSKINPKHLELEITEGILIDDFDDILAKLNQIKDMEISISLDDFGTGYSSIRYLRVLPISTLKIDKSFIKDITLEGNKETDITESIVSMVAKMGLDTIAEGVETAEQYETLKGFGEKKVNVQGFLKGKPMPKYLCDKILSGDMNAILSLENDRTEAD